METQNINFIRYEYVRIPNLFKYSEYILKNGKNEYLPNKIRIEKNRKFNEGYNFDEFLRLIDQLKVKDCNVKTGLRAIQKENCFYGDLIQKSSNQEIIKSFILVQFSNEKQNMVIDYFKGFKPLNSVLKQEIINSHNFKYSINIK